MANISDIAQKHRPDLDPLQELYKHFHRNPELSNLEEKTTATIAEQLQNISADLDVKTNIGGYGIAAVLRNGDGPTTLLRADFDALPVEEQTGLEYASTKRMADTRGNEKPVMHACGHDMHATCLVGAAQALYAARNSWSGTIVFCFQPGEEVGTGALGMIDDGIYEKHNVPVPEIVLAGHVLPLRTGVVATRTGLIANSADSLHVTIHGRGAHASMPDRSIDPIPVVASIILKLQTIVSREMDPHDSSCVTVAAVHAGDSDNVICDDATLSLDVRTASQASRDHVIASIKRIVRCESEAGRCVKEPTIEFTRNYPVTINDAGAVKKISETFAHHFGEGEQAFDPDCSPVGASEDFSNLATAVSKPYCTLPVCPVDPH